MGPTVGLAFVDPLPELAWVGLSFVIAFAVVVVVAGVVAYSRALRRRR